MCFCYYKRRGKPEIELNRWNQSITEGYGENGRFKMEVFASQESKFEIVGDTLYQYFSFRADADFDGKIKIVDTMNRNKKYKYSLSDMERYHEYIIDENTTITISPIGIVIDSPSEINGKITFHYKNGKDKVVIDTSEGTGTGLSRVSKEDDRVRSQCVFKQLQEIQNIDYVLFNNKKLQEGSCIE